MRHAVLGRKAAVKFKSADELSSTLTELYGQKAFPKLIQTATSALGGGAPAGVTEVALHLRGEGNFASGAYAAALLDFSLLLQAFPRTALRTRALLLRGDCFVHLGLPKAARVDYHEVAQFSTEEGKAALGRLERMGE